MVYIILWCKDINAGVNMIQFGIFLALGGVVGALLRQHKKGKVVINRAALPNSEVENKGGMSFAKNSADNNKVFDDVGELNHYQKVALYTFALSAASSWFYPPVRLICFPLLGYNTYHFYHTIRNSDKVNQRSPMTVFEGIGVVGSLLTGSIVAGSLLLLFVFGSRKLLLNAGNIANNVGFSDPFKPRYARVWVMRNGAEIDLAVSEVIESDIIILRAGEIVVIEGEVLSGEGNISQFSLHKKMKIISKQKGDRVYPFTQLESGTLQVKML